MLIIIAWLTVQQYFVSELFPTTQNVTRRDITPVNARESRIDYLHIVQRYRAILRHRNAIFWALGNL